MITLDYTFMMSAAVSGGIADADLEAVAAGFRAARDATLARHARGELGFLDLPAEERSLAASKSLADWAHDRGFTDVVLLGIGGSALGPIALRNALRPSGWNSLTESARGGLPRLHVLDNIDPSTVAAVLERVDTATTLFTVISKSGGTAETMAQYLIARGRVEQARLAPRDHFVFVTDPEKGALRRIAREDKIRALEIPPNVGGRFSVLSSVGVFPAALVGIDVDALLDGAGAMRRRCQGPELRENPAGLYAALQWMADERMGRRIHVFMPYSDPLREVAAWFVQLWAESLGKIRQDGSDASVGPTPVPAVGASDQHSQVQLFMEGPLDKTVTFVAVEHGGVDLEIPARHVEHNDLAYLGGHNLSELLDVERRATAGALAARGCPSMTIEFERVDAWHVGGLLMLLEIATAYAGELYRVDAFGQPGVEMGKRFTYAMLGRPGFEAARAAWEELPASDQRYVT